MSKRVGVLGSGQVAKVLASGFRKHGYAVMLGTRSPDKVAAFARETGMEVGDFAAAAAHAELVVLAVKGIGAIEVARAAGAAQLDGKVVIDTTNPIAEGPPQGAMIRYFTGPNDSLMERLQAALPGARFVKAFSQVGNAFMVDPAFPDGPPTMFICGNDAEAKRTVTGVLQQFGWDAEDIGGVEGARAIEPLCQLWCAPGFLRNQWTHAFKLLKL